MYRGYFARESERICCSKDLPLWTHNMQCHWHLHCPANTIKFRQGNFATFLIDEFSHKITPAGFNQLKIKNTLVQHLLSNSLLNPPAVACQNACPSMRPPTIPSAYAPTELSNSIGLHLPKECTGGP